MISRSVAPSPVTNMPATTPVTMVRIGSSAFRARHSTPSAGWTSAMSSAVWFDTVVSGATGARLGRMHGPEVPTQADHGENHGERQQRIEAVGDRVEKHHVGVQFQAGNACNRIADQTDLVADPCGDQSDGRNGCRG